MMAGLYSPFKVYTPGEVLTAADLNATDQNHITNQIPQVTDDYSADLTQKRQQSDPTNTLATSLAIELQQIRYVLAKLGAKSFWDQVTGPVAMVSGTGTGTRQLRGIAFGTVSTLQLDADAVVFSGGSVKQHVSATLNIATPGPAAGGRDRAADYGPNQWVNVFYIYNPTASIVALTATVEVNTMQPPALPTGYTEYCYATSLRVGSVANQWLVGGQLAQVCGSQVVYHPYIQVLTQGGHTPKTLVSIINQVPTDRIYGTTYKLFIEPRPIPAGGAVVGVVNIRTHEDINTVSYTMEHTGTTAVKSAGSELTLPVWEFPNIWYSSSTSIGTIFTDIYVLSYRIPNNDV